MFYCFPNEIQLPGTQSFSIFGSGRVGYLKKSSGQVGYRDPVRPWLRPMFTLLIFLNPLKICPVFPDKPIFTMPIKKRTQKPNHLKEPTLYDHFGNPLDQVDLLYLTRHPRHHPHHHPHHNPHSHPHLPHHPTSITTMTPTRFWKGTRNWRRRRDQRLPRSPPWSGRPGRGCSPRSGLSSIATSFSRSTLQTQECCLLRLVFFLNCSILPPSLHRPTSPISSFILVQDIPIRLAW